MGSEDGKEVYASETTTSVPPVKRGKRRACADHCKRFWWLHLIIFCCITVLVVCLVIFVAVPKIAQSKVNDAKLEVQGVNVLQTTPDTYLMEINSTITTDGSIKATIYGFTGEMYLEDLPDHKPFATVDFPQTNGDKHQKVNVSQPLTIADHDAFNEFNVWFYKNETVRITISGRTDVKPSGLDRKYGVDFKKTVTLNGLNRFNGTTVSNGHVTTSMKSNNFNATTSIPNASVFTLDIGNATFNNFLDNKLIGNFTLENVILRPGVNTLPLSAKMDSVTVLTAVTSPKYCKTGILPMNLLGTDVVNHGKRLEYFAEALGSANQTVNIDFNEILKNSGFGDSLGCSSA